MSRGNFKRIAAKVRAKDKVKNASSGAPPSSDSQQPPPAPPPAVAAISEEEFKRRTKTMEDEATVHSLAALSHPEYDKVRKSEAEKLGVRVGTLDELVEKARAASSSSTVQLPGHKVLFPVREAWPYSVTGAEVLSEISQVISQYLVLPDGAADAFALWCAHTHVYHVFRHTPRLHVTAPGSSCGKTTTLDVGGCFVLRPMKLELLTTATLFRIVEEFKPTLLVDEVSSSVLREKEELLQVLNGGHKRGVWVPRCVGEDHKISLFDIFAPVMLCGIGPLPEQPHNRSIVIHMERAMANEIKKRFREEHTEREEELCRKLMRFCADNEEKFKLDPDLPVQAANRLADNWRPLFAVAQVAGGDWPQRVYSAFVKLTARDEVDLESPGIRLLRDIKRIFETHHFLQPVVSSAELHSLLLSIEDGEWEEWQGPNRPITKWKVASFLAPFKITPKRHHIGGSYLRGYLRADFKRPFERYMPQTEPELF
jgi:putative DNA primase/helicase